MDKKAVIVVMSFEVEVENVNDENELLRAVKKQIDNNGLDASLIDGIRDWH